MNKWKELSERDRYVAIFGILLLTVYLLYVLIYAPLFNAIESNHNKLFTQRDTLEWMSNVPRGKLMNQAHVTKSSTQILAIMSQQLANSVFKADHYQLQQLGNNDLQLSFDQVPYNKFIEWLWTFTEKNHLSIRQFNVEKTKLVGAVKLQVIFGL